MNRELVVLNNEKVIVSDEKGNISKRNNTPYIIDILNVENEIEMGEKEIELIKNKIDNSNNKIKRLNEAIIKSIELYILSTVGIGVLTLNVFTTALFLAPVLCTFVVLFDNCKKDENNNINDLNAQLKVINSNEFKLNVILGDLKARANMFIFDKEKNKKMKEYALVKESMKDDIKENIEEVNNDSLDQKRLSMHK